MTKKPPTREKWRITPAQQQLVCELYQTGLMIKDVASRCNIDPRTVSKILTRAHIRHRSSSRRSDTAGSGENLKDLKEYVLPRRCQHKEQFWLHTPPTPYFQQCVQEEWCAACAAKKTRNRQSPPDVIITKSKRRKPLTFNPTRSDNYAMDSRTK